MTETAIRVRDLGKQYVVGGEWQPYGSLRESLARAAALPGQLLRRGGARAPERDTTFWALRDVSFDVPRGEALGIVGGNGAGKSTLLKILSRITEPSTGVVACRGTVAAMLEAGTGFHPELSGRENIVLSAAVLGMRRAEVYRKFDQIVEFAEVDGFLDTPIKHYSSGMQLRLAFAVAAHLEPDILLVDEVLAVGDLKFQRKCLKRMEQIGGEGHTVLFVSHDLAALRRICSSAIWVDGGRIRAFGETSEVLDAYQHASLGTSTGSIGVFERAPDERSGRSAWIERITLRAADGTPSVSYPYGSPMIVEFDIGGQPLRDSFGVEWHLLSEKQELLAYGGNVPTQGLRAERGCRRFRCEIASLPLTAGTYSLSALVRVFDDAPWDYWQNAAAFSVTPFDQHDTGFVYTSARYGSLLLQQRWSVG